MYKKLTTLTIAIILIGAGCSLVSKKVKPTDNTINSQQFSNKDYEYRLDSFSGVKLDQRFVRKNKKSNEDYVIFESIKDKLPELKIDNNFSLAIFAQPDDSDLIIFRSGNYEINAPGGTFYSFNKNSNIITRMSVTDLNVNSSGFVVLSENQKKFVWVPDAVNDTGDAKIMYVVDFVNDNYSKVLNLNNNETFNGGRQAMSMYFDIAWVDQNTIKYAVFDQLKKDQNFDPFSNDVIKNIFIEYREINI